MERRPAAARRCRAVAIRSRSAMRACRWSGTRRRPPRRGSRRACAARRVVAGRRGRARAAPHSPVALSSPRRWRRAARRGCRAPGRTAARAGRAGSRRAGRRASPRSGARSDSGRRSAGTAPRCRRTPRGSASTSGLVGSMKRRCKPSSSACVVSCATMSCDRQVKTVPPGRLSPRRRRLEPGSSRRAAPSSPGCSRRSPRAARADRCAGAARNPRSGVLLGVLPATAAPTAPCGRAPARSCRSSSSPPRRPSADGTAGSPPRARARPARAEADRRDRPARRRTGSPGRSPHLEVLADRPGLESSSHGTWSVI